MNQRRTLRNAERVLRLGPAAMARAFGVSTAEYRHLRNGRHVLDKHSRRILDALLRYPKQAHNAFKRPPRDGRSEPDIVFIAEYFGAGGKSM